MFTDPMSSPLTRAGAAIAGSKCGLEEADIQSLDGNEYIIMFTSFLEEALDLYTSISYASHICWFSMEELKELEESILHYKRLDELGLLYTLGGLLDKIIDVMYIVLVYIHLMLNTVFSGFSEFPNSMRPPCTTMPWTIWPALVVLWGVCWMFYIPPNPADERQLQLSLQDAEWTYFSSSEDGFNQLRPALLTHQDISEHSALEYSNSLPGSFDWPNEIDFHYFPASEETDMINDPILEQVAPSPSPDQGFQLNFESSIEFLNAGNLAEQLLIIAPTENNFAMLSSAEGPRMTLSSEASIHVEQTALPSQPSAISAQPQQPPRNSDGQLICDHVDCNNKTLIFTNIRDWSKHKDKHERPYRCTVKNCIRTQGFATKGDQIRHERVIHRTPIDGVGSQSSNSTLLYCNEPNCARGPGTGKAGFNRRDNLMDHMKRKHGRILPSSRASTSREIGNANESTPLDTQKTASPKLRTQQQMASLGTATSGKQRRIAADQNLDMEDIEEEHVNPRKRQRQEDRRHDTNGDTEPTPREQALMLEVENLRRELQKSQRDKDVLIGVIGRLTRGPRGLEEGSPS